MPTVPVNDLRRGFAAQAAELRDAVNAVLDGGWYVHGPEHSAFEREFADFVGVPHALGVASGTDALELALTAVSTDERRVVVTAANAGGYTSVAAARCGMEVRYCDVDPQTLCMDPAALEGVLGDDVAAVVLTHLYGRLGDVDRIGALCARTGGRLIEDCAQAVGATRGGRRAGSFGDAATFSFYPTKNLGALGDGGAVVTRDEGIAESVRSLRQYGWRGKYVIQLPHGQNSRLDELQAAVLRRRLPHVDRNNARRREIVRRYAAAGATSVTVLDVPDDSHVAHLAVVLCEDREAARAAFTAAEVGTDVHYPVPDHQQPALRSPGAPALPVTEAVLGHLLTLPCFPELTDDEVDQVCRVLARL